MSISKIVTSFLVLLSSIVVGLYAYLGSYSQLMADDFCSVYFSERLGIFRSIWYWYISWHGGFSASFADALLGLFGRSGIGFVVPLVILFWVLSLTLSIASFLSYQGPVQRYSIAVSATLLVLYGTFIFSPATSASIIWWGGLRGYIPPLIITPIYLALYGLFSRHAWPGRARYFWYVISFGFTFVNGGFSESFTPLQIVILFLLLAGEFYVHRDTLWSPKLFFLLAGILGGILALVVMVMAPGNASRQAFFPSPPPPLEFILIALKSYLIVGAGFFLGPQKIAALIGLFTASLFLGTFWRGLRHFNFRNLLIVMGMGMLFAYCCFLPAAYGQSTGPSDTSLIIPVFILMLTLVTTGIFCGGYLTKNTQTSKQQRYALLLSLILFVTLGYSTIVKVEDLSAEIGRATVYAKNWSIRDQQIKQAKLSGNKDVFVPAIPRWITVEPSDNPKFFVNQCMSLYYGINVRSSADANE